MKRKKRRPQILVQRFIVGGGLVCCFVLLIVVLVDNKYNLLTSDQKGYRLFHKEKFTLAADEFSTLLWKGAAMYRAGDFVKASAAFSGIDSAEGALNHGNSLVMLGKYEEAIERYERALTLKPGWAPAQNNLAIAKGRAKTLEKKGGEMTGGKLGADEYVFSNNSSKDKGDKETIAGDEPSEAEQRAIWLRQVQTKPADFLRTKFAYQYQMTDQTPAVPDEKTSEHNSGQE